MHNKNIGTRASIEMSHEYTWTFETKGWHDSEVPPAVKSSEHFFFSDKSSIVHEAQKMMVIPSLRFQDMFLPFRQGHAVNVLR